MMPRYDLGRISRYHLKKQNLQYSEGALTAAMFEQYVDLDTRPEK